ncbi:DUF2141 domain-containing protein [Plebeiibacterium marinum]|uniref:DUF2141 domain-containing protein n=1 Tax=Plebeiibacterium marinum TaxID=2992111 RepID=A0AAE3MG95_9BACT|nr:DUF2141 domain-containing protein [Plebeiobacterium marinum]MCW3807036.1 DUF2141 domain-containing protein [Plebeiobacterium marinum]
MKNISLLVFMVVLGQYVFSQTPSLTINVPNIDPKVGELQVSVFNSEESFLKENEEYKIYRFKIDKSDGKFIISDLQEGIYALVIYHDKNNNKEMDRSFLGIPKEGYAFSNNYKPSLSGPDFEDCSFALKANKELVIKLMY